MDDLWGGESCPHFAHLCCCRTLVEPVRDVVEVVVEQVGVGVEGEWLDPGFGCRT